MVVDGKGSEKCALVGDNLAELGFQNGWSGIIINGCIRDRAIPALIILRRIKFIIKDEKI